MEFMSNSLPNIFEHIRNHNKCTCFYPQEKHYQGYSIKECHYLMIKIFFSIQTSDSVKKDYVYRMITNKTAFLI